MNMRSATYEAQSLKGSDLINTSVNFLFSDFRYDKMRVGIAPLIGIDADYHETL